MPARHGQAFACPGRPWRRTLRPRARRSRLWQLGGSRYRQDSSSSDPTRPRPRSLPGPPRSEERPAGAALQDYARFELMATRDRYQAPPSRGPAGPNESLVRDLAPVRPSQPAGTRNGATVVPIGGVAARLLERMNASLGVPTATSFREIRVAVLEARRTQLNIALAPRKLSYTHLIARSVRVRSPLPRPRPRSVITGCTRSTASRSP